MTLKRITVTDNSVVKMGVAESVRLFLMMTLHLLKHSLLKFVVLPLVSFNLTSNDYQEKSFIFICI